MYKIIKDNKIIGISENTPSLLDKYQVIEDLEHSINDYIAYKNEYILKTDLPVPTKEEQSAKRAEAYLAEVDPITCHIQRLKDEEQTPEIEQEILELKQERSKKINEIKERYPYPEEESE